jgi:hypothetical protein
MSEQKNDFEIMLDRLIGITEKTIETQSKFLKEIHELKSRFDMNDRDHKDVKETLERIVNNSFETLNIMKKTSNEDVIIAVEKLHSTLSSLDIDDMGKDITSIKDSYKIVKWIVALITSIVIIFQVFFGAVQTMKNDRTKKELKTHIELLLKRGK